MDFSSVLILDSLTDKDKLPKSVILIHADVLPHSRTFVPYQLISDSDIFGDNLGFAEITSVSCLGHVAPRLTRRRHLGHVLVLRKYISTRQKLCVFRKSKLYYLYIGYVVSFYRFHHLRMPR
mgnify:CR=1 FL=1